MFDTLSLKKYNTKIEKIMAYDSNNTNSLLHPSFLLLSTFLLIAITIAYSNHFENAFHFDDSHTIEDNPSIHQFNVFNFFTDGTTFSSLPSNQSYRPYITTVNSIDYNISNGLKPKAFHIHIFLGFLLCCALISIMVKKILDKISFSNYNNFWGLLCAAIFGLLCANAETVNYIIQRAEIIAGMYVVAGFIAYLSNGIWKQKYLYLVFPLIGFFAKEMAFVFAPLLFIYILIFEENTDLLHFYRQNEFKKCINAIFKAFPAFVLTIAFYIFYTIMTPKTFTPGGFDKFKYFITQPLVIIHYAFSFFVPYNLSADTDWKPFESIFDYRAILGIILLTILIYTALKLSAKKETQLISFGILWFFVSLLPTSSFIAFAEVLNDHRPFIPYIGLTIAAVFGIRWILLEYFKKFIAQPIFQNIFAITVVAFLTLNAYGVYQRNKVWATDETLWADVAVKSPKNGRGLMNYGLTFMAKGDYASAEKYFLQALPLTPTYSHLYINLGILKNATGKKNEAEAFYKKAIQFANSNSLGAYQFYADFLINNNRAEEAIPLLNKILEITPNNTNALNSLTKAKSAGAKTFEEKYTTILNTIKSKPNEAAYLDLSLMCYNTAHYEESIAMAKEAIKLNPNSHLAYNNICSAYNQMKMWNEAIKACEKGIEINTNFALLKGNLAWAKDQKAKGL
jgi:tetratricopeptide (TPR) repeat protein